MTATDPQRRVEAVWRIESARLIAALARMVGDVGLAEELGQEALVAALEQWPASGVPDKPGAWLMTVAKRRAIDQLRRNERLQRKVAELGRDLETEADDADLEQIVEEDLGDDLLRLVFIACHPVLSTEARVALTLRLLGGLTTGEIARAFLVPEATVAQRIARAKRTLARKQIPFETPDEGERTVRLPSVLEVVYLIFNEGYAATGGRDWVRPELCEDGLRLGRVLAGLLPKEAEVHGLVALMELQASRLRARVGPTGQPILLEQQDRARWDRLLIRRGLTALQRTEKLTGGRLGVYGLQAAIAACHARAPSAADTDWERIAAYYADLAMLTGSPVVELNRAVAVAMARGPASGLAVIDALANEPALQRYHLLPAVRGDLLARLGHDTEAAAEFTRAAELTRNERERAVLLRRAGSPLQAPE